MRKNQIRYLAKFIFISVITLHINVTAVRHVGNGGGEAELKLIRMNEQINEYKTVCAIFISDCMKNADLELVSFLNEESVKLILNFDADIGDPKQMYINSNLLYSFETKKPLSDPELMQILLLHYFGSVDQNSKAIQLKTYIGIQKTGMEDLVLVQMNLSTKLVSLENKMNLNKLIKARYKIQDFEIINIDAFYKSALIRDKNSFNYYEVFFVFAENVIIDLDVRFVLID